MLGSSSISKINVRYTYAPYNERKTSSYLRNLKYIDIEYICIHINSVGMNDGVTIKHASITHGKAPYS
jgi:hypothetical protein